MVRIDDLPNDIGALKRLVIEREVSAQHLIQTIAQIKNEAAAQLEAERVRHAAELKAAIQALLRRYYGPRSEQFDPRQLLLFGELATEHPLNAASIAAEAGEKLTTRRIKNRDQHGRQQLPAHLERIEIEHDLSESQKKCPGCGELRCRIGSEVSEQLEYFPANFKVLKHVRHKYACTKCDQDGYNPNIEVAVKPPQPIERGLPGPSLLAHIITSKLGDHLPLYRLEGIFVRQEVEIARSTMCAWMRVCGELVQPLVDLMTGRVKQSRFIRTDDTVVPIQSSHDEARPVGKRCRQGRIWCYLGDDQNPYTVYDYTPNRQRAGPAKWLGNYQGYLQADAYGGYDGIYATTKVVEVACWAHARRKFYDAQDSDQKRASIMLALVGELYNIERVAKESAEAARLQLRQEQSVPILARIKNWLETEREIVLPRSPIAQAMQYALNQWEALCVYTTCGFLEIDNNASERALKRVAIGRKNWLFAGHDLAAQNQARLWSLIASCERHQVDPQAYLTSVLAKLPPLCRDTQTGAARVPTAVELEQFLPDVWKREDAAEPARAPAADEVKS